MKVEAQPSDREVLAGLVECITYQNADSGFCVVRVKARGHRDLVTLVGHAATISAGEWNQGSSNPPATRCFVRQPMSTQARSRGDRQRAIADAFARDQEIP
jgi:hypothetical protein